MFVKLHEVQFWCDTDLPTIAWLTVTTKVSATPVHQWMSFTSLSIDTDEHSDRLFTWGKKILIKFKPYKISVTEIQISHAVQNTKTISSPHIPIFRLGGWGLGGGGGEWGWGESTPAAFFMIHHKSRFSKQWHIPKEKWGTHTLCMKVNLLFHSAHRFWRRKQKQEQKHPTHSLIHSHSFCHGYIWKPPNIQVNTDMVHKRSLV